jgi:hypothetical protein
MKLLLTIWLLLLPTLASAATYYVRTDGNDSNLGTSNSAGGAWLTIGKCASTIVAGDFCRVQAGTYAAVVTEATDGSAGNFITYVADGAVTNHGWVITGDYVRIIGFIVEGASTRNDGIYIQDATHVEVWNNTVQNFQRDSIRCDGGGSVTQCDNAVFIGNVSFSSLLKDFQVRGTDILVAYNESDSATADFAYVFGQRHRYLNNYSHDIASGVDTHTDFLQTGSDEELGFGQMLYEANLYVDEDGSDHHCINLETNGTDAFHIFRRNIWASKGVVGGQCYAFASNSMDDTKVYFETVHYNSILTFFDRDAGPAARTSVLNSIFMDAWQGATPEVYDDEPTRHDYNLFFDPDGSMNFQAEIDAEANTQQNVDPLFTSSATQDYTLQSGSLARDAGVALTTVSGSDTSATFNVAAGGGAYFRGAGGFTQYGDDLAPGDRIRVGSDTVEIASISTDAITATASFTFADTEAVHLASDDTTPDIGALPYRAGGYTLSATYTGSGTITVTPNDASLVRFVICYEDNVPYAVDNSSPYTCTDPTGTFSARAYPLYASTTLWAVATDAGEPVEPDLTPRRFRFKLAADVNTYQQYLKKAA